MNKKTVIIVAIAILATAIIVGGGVYFLTNKNKTSTNTTSSNNSQTTTKPTNKKLEGNAQVQAVLDKVKANTPTVTATKVLNEQTDTNNMIGKQGQYQYAGDYYDTRTNSTVTATEDYGVSQGGAIEIFANSKDATTRGNYLGQFQTGLIQAGAYKVVDNVVLRVSENYTATQQKEMLALMESAL